MTTDDLDQMRASDDGMPERDVPAALMIAVTGGRLPSGVAVRSLKFKRRPAGGRERPLEGHTVGYDEDLRLPLIEWEDRTGPEACEADEFEVVDQ